MGCTNSKSVVAEPDKAALEGTDKGSRAASNRSLVDDQEVLTDMPPRTNVRVPSDKSLTNNPNSAKKPDGVKSNADAQWTSLWNSHRQLLLDPADVHSTIEDLMGRATNKLSPSEVTFIQRKVRRVITKSNIPDTKKSKRMVKSASSNALDQDSRGVADRHHLLTNHVIQQVLPSITPIEGSSVNPFEAIYLLLFYTHESLWDRVADAAVESAKAAGFNMDVNALQPPFSVPPIYRPNLNEPSEVAPGVSLNSLTFLMGLALHGSRLQKLQLLFYILLPSKVLHGFLSKHPAGGVPVWLLEVGNDTILSLASLTHYYLFGDAFTPAKSGQYHNPEKTPSPLSLDGKDVMDFIMSILTSTVDSEESGSDNSAATPKTPLTKTSSRVKRGDQSVSSEGDLDDVAQTEVMDRLHDEKETFILDDYIKGDTESLKKLRSSKLPEGSVDMKTFLEWSNKALGDSALEAIMYRLFAHGVLPSPSMELELVASRWKDWQKSDCATWYETLTKSEGALDSLTQSVRKALTSEEENKSEEEEGDSNKLQRKAFGGLGGFDGMGGFGLGVMYCIDKQWWDSFEAYVGAGETHGVRPKPLSNELLLDRSNEVVVPGILGSYELMKKDLKLGVDYVLIPPGVWDVLYEMYGGGPPLPRMVVNPKSSGISSYLPSVMSEQPEAPTEIDLDAMASKHATNRFLRIPNMMHVETHPWILHFHLCDPQQPYRRGDTGPMTIRVMALPNQPLWRLYAEITVRLPFSAYRVFDTNGRGRARLWKRTDPTGPKDAMSRYGPWTLLCKNRYAILPDQNIEEEFEKNFEELKKNWEEFGDNSTIESIGLSDGDQIMVECATLNRGGQFIWPREAAAKAGHVRQLADEDTKFRQLLRGLDGENKALAEPPKLVGLTVDALDITGRWYQVEILQVQNAPDETDEEDDDSMASYEGRKEGEHKELLVDFAPHGGHSEWIHIDSDRLASAGRFTLGKEDDVAPDGSVRDISEKTKQTQVKKTSPDAGENGKLCPIPGFGACGLTNLGNTCYANSAIQCISYLPLVRAYLLSGQYKATGDLNRDNPLGTGGKLLEEFAELLRQMWSAKLGEKAPRGFKAQLGKANMQFAGADQQDAQEFLNFLLDSLHEDANRIRKKPYVEGIEDDWVKKTDLHRVGVESWRRFLRRNRSIMADVAMGQVLNTVTCPTCNHSSRNFDPFNLLSLPFPTVADVIFKCQVVRRGSALNTPWVMNKPRKNGKSRIRFNFRQNKNPKPPADELVVEEYFIAMSRLADSADLVDEIAELCKIPPQYLRLCRGDDISLPGKDGDDTVVKQQTQVSVMTDKEGPCSQFVKQESAKSGGVEPALIVAFESTLRPRPRRRSPDGYSDGDDDEMPGMAMTKGEFKEMEEQAVAYGNNEECRLYDTEPSQIAKAISRSIWPRTEADFKLGLRVDAIDHRQNWFPGSVVEIIESSEENEESKDQDGAKPKVRIHFDNFSSKWDEMYTIDHFLQGRVKPVYSHAMPRSKPTEFIVHHRYMDRARRCSNLFGQTFFVQCHNEWSTARAGAQILAQASRFLRLPPDFEDKSGEREAKVQRLYDRTQAVISDLIDLLIDSDKEYVHGALGMLSDGEDEEVKKYRNPVFDASELSSTLVKRVNTLLHRLPFEVRVCAADAPLGGTNEEVAFPFSLMRTIGNYMNSKHAVVLQWREPPSDKKATGPAGGNYLGAPVMYVPPVVQVDQESKKILEKAIEEAEKAAAHGNSGLPLGVCLSEFCKPQQLDADSWRCPRCKDFREGKQSLELWRLPDILTIHIKRFNCSARWREKITTKVNFPLTGLDLTKWCHEQAPAFENLSNGSNVYDLIGVMNHYGGMTGGHYVATCKATTCGRDGREEVAFDFNGAGAGKVVLSDEEQAAQSGWGLGRKKVDANPNKLTAASTSKVTEESAEPVWLQFDDEMVEPIAPKHVVSEMAYVLFYRRRQITPSNIARYSTLE